VSACELVLPSLRDSVVVRNLRPGLDSTAAARLHGGNAEQRCPTASGTDIRISPQARQNFELLPLQRRRREELSPQRKLRVADDFMSSPAGTADSDSSDSGAPPITPLL
jgi:hypothetical protein